MAEMYKSRRDEISDMITEEHQQAKKLLYAAHNYLSNRLAKCPCTREELCVECVDNKRLMQEIIAFG